jgi:hypothetical protein
VSDPICGKCGFPIHEQGSARHFGFFMAHEENECVRLLKERAERAEAERDERVMEAHKLANALSDCIAANGRIHVHAEAMRDLCVDLWREQYPEGEGWNNTPDCVADYDRDFPKEGT